MAKIEMDVSEYEIMNENKRLLEESLKNERELRDKISILEKEKQKTLENAQKKIVKTIVIKKQEVALVSKDSKTIWNNVLKDFSIFMDYNFHTNLNIRDSYFGQQFVNAFFDKQVIVDESETQTAFVGLNETKEEIKKQLLKEIQKEIIDKANSYDSLYSENKRLADTNVMLRKSVDNFKKINTTDEKTIKELEEESKRLNLVEDFVINMEFVLNTKKTWFGKIKSYNKIRKHLWEKKKTW